MRERRKERQEWRERESDNVDWCACLQGPRNARKGGREVELRYREWARGKERKSE